MDTVDRGVLLTFTFHMYNYPKMVMIYCPGKFNRQPSFIHLKIRTSSPSAGRRVTTAAGLRCGWLASSVAECLSSVRGMSPPPGPSAFAELATTTLPCGCGCGRGAPVLLCHRPLILARILGIAGRPNASMPHVNSAMAQRAMEEKWNVVSHDSIQPATDPTRRVAEIVVLEEK